MYVSWNDDRRSRCCVGPNRPSAALPVTLLAAAIVLTIGVSACAQPIPHTAPEVEHDPPNIVLVVLDDVGHELLDASCTPNIDALAARGMSFSRFYVAPTCSPTRAMLLTGRHAFRTGVGRAINRSIPGEFVAPRWGSIPRRLRRYSTAAVGKWHLATEAAPGLLTHPLTFGFDSFVGTSFNLGESYYAWDRNDNGTVAPCTTYVTTQTINDAIAAISSTRSPWFLYVALHAPHQPLEPTPPGLATCDPENTSELGLTESMLEATDTELARLFDRAGPDALVFVLGDNGSNGETVGLPGRAKGTLYEGGVRVPLIVAGRGVAAGACDRIVSAVDVYATILDAAGVAIPLLSDGVSMRPLLAGGNEPIRAAALCELFKPLGVPDTNTEWQRAAVNETHKLIAERIRVFPPTWRFELYDLVADPGETANLYPPSAPADVAAFDALWGYLEAAMP